MAARRPDLNDWESGDLRRLCGFRDRQSDETGGAGRVETGSGTPGSCRCAGAARATIWSAGVLGLIAEVGAPTKQVLKIKLLGVRAKLTIQGNWGAPDSEWLRRALGGKRAV